MRISDWSSDVCSSDLRFEGLTPASVQQRLRALDGSVGSQLLKRAGRTVQPTVAGRRILEQARKILSDARDLRSMASDTELPAGPLHLGAKRSEEHTSELQSLMTISYADSCLLHNNTRTSIPTHH